MADSATVMVHLDHDLRDRLELLSQITGRSVSTLTAEAVAEYVACQQAQIEAIREGIAAADRGDLISHEEVMAELHDRIRARSR